MVRINDRGPFVTGRFIDATRAAAQKLGFHGAGVAQVRPDVLGRRAFPQICPCRRAPSKA